MISIEKICTSTVMVVMLATFILLALFFAILYFVLQKKKSMLYLFLAGICQLVIVVFLYIEKYTTDAGYLMMGNIANVLLMTFWVSAIFVILDIKSIKIPLAIANAINVAQAMTFYIIMNTNHVVNIISAFIMGIIAIYCSVLILRAKALERTREVFSSAVIIGVFGLINIVRAVYRIFRPQYINAFSDLDQTGALFLIISLGFSYIINFLILFLHFNDLNITIQRLLRVDSLTGAFTRDTFFVMAQQKMREVKRHDRNIAVALIDIDNFKNINDTYGHNTGDKVLSWFVRNIKSSLRENDIIGRIGGEEFVLVLEVKSSEDAFVAFMRIREGLAPSDNRPINENVTFSGGYVFIDKNRSDSDIKDILKEADEKMYKAKKMGKNMVL